MSEGPNPDGLKTVVLDDGSKRAKAARILTERYDSVEEVVEVSAGIGRTHVSAIDWIRVIVAQIEIWESKGYRQVVVGPCLDASKWVNTFNLTLKYAGSAIKVVHPTELMSDQSIEALLDPQS